MKKYYCVCTSGAVWGQIAVDERVSLWRNVLLGGLAVIALAGCSGQVANDLDAPIKAISGTDVVIETNVSAVLQSAQAVLATSGSFAAFTGAGSGTAVTTAASSGPGDISYAVTTGGEGIMLVGWNRADDHCVGALYLHESPPAPVLGATAAGQYDFVAPATTSAECDAAGFVSRATAPNRWPESPSTSGWKLP